MHNLQTALAVTLASGYRYLSPVPVPNYFNPCIMCVHLVSLPPLPNSQAIKDRPALPPYDAKRVGTPKMSAPLLLQAEGVYPPAPRVRDVAFPEPH